MYIQHAIHSSEFSELGQRIESWWGSCKGRRAYYKFISLLNFSKSPTYEQILTSCFMRNLITFCWR